MDDTQVRAEQFNRDAENDELRAGLAELSGVRRDFAKTKSIFAARVRKIAQAALTGHAIKKIHPESYCHRCFDRNPSCWYTDNDIWNATVRAKGEKEVLCPTCLIELHEKLVGHPCSWRLSLEDDTLEIDKLRERLYDRGMELARLTQLLNSKQEE